MSPTPTRDPSLPAPGASVEFLWTIPDPLIVRFAARIQNDGERSIEGVRVRFAAYDVADREVGMIMHDVPAVAAGEAYWFIGEGGEETFSGAPARVTAEILEFGDWSDAPSPRLPISGLKIEELEAGERGVKRFRVTGVVTNGTEDAQGIRGAILLGGPNATIVGISSLADSIAKVTSPIAAGAEVPLDEVVETGPRAEVVVVEVYAYPE